MAVSRVRVRTLGEFVFCPRAGLLSHASADEEDEPTDERMNLNFLPEYSLTLIEEQLAVQLRRLTRWAAWAAGGLFLVVVAVSNELPPAVPLALAVPTVLCVWKTLQALSAVVTLGDRRRAALSATSTEPPADLTDDTPVRWWELLKAGFESVPYLEPLFDGESALAGKPWRVLKKGSLRIPVIRLPADNYHAGAVLGVRAAPGSARGLRPVAGRVRRRSDAVRRRAVRRELRRGRGPDPFGD